MAKFYTYAPDLRPGLAELALDRRESHHLFHVLRWRPDDELYAFNGHGLVAELVRPAGLADRKFSIGRLFQWPPRRPKIILMQSLIRTEAMDTVVGRSAELAVDEIWPIRSLRSAKLASPEATVRRLDRWRRLAVEACKQSKNPWLPKIAAPQPLADAIGNVPRNGTRLVASLQSNATSMAEVGAEIGTEAAEIHLLVGPEGDFSGDEYDLLRSHHFTAISLGENILTSEMAAVAMVLLARIFGQQPMGYGHGEVVEGSSVA